MRLTITAAIHARWGHHVDGLIHSHAWTVEATVEGPADADIVMPADDLEDLRPCLELFVPVVQRSAVDFVNDPARTNATIVDVVEQYDTFWTYTAELADFSVQTQLELGLTGNGPDDTIGNMDEERIATVLQQVRDAGLEVPEDLEPTDLFTNEFIDESIGLSP